MIYFPSEISHPLHRRSEGASGDDSFRGVSISNEEMTYGTWQTQGFHGEGCRRAQKGSQAQGRPEASRWEKAPQVVLPNGDFPCQSASSSARPSTRGRCLWTRSTASEPFTGIAWKIDPPPSPARTAKSSDPARTSADGLDWYPGAAKSLAGIIGSSTGSSRPTAGRIKGEVNYGIYTRHSRC